MLNVKLPTKIHPQKNHLAKLPLGGDALFVAELVKKQAQPFLFIVNDGYQLQRLASEISVFAPELRIAIFPDYEVLPYERQSPYNELIAERLRTLWQVQHKQIDLLLVQATTLQMLLPPQEYFTQRVLLVKLGDKLDSEQLRSQLSASGYQCVQQVYEAGEFAIRGSIIDILPMGSKQAIRIDLFDDEVETIHVFDSKTQLIINPLDAVEILPSREYPHDPQSVRQMAAQFCAMFPKEQGSNLAKDLKNNILPAGVEFYLPLFFAKCATLFDYLDDTWQVAYGNELLGQLNLNWQEITKRYDYYNYQFPCLRPSELFLSTDEVFAKLKAHQCWEIAQTGEFYPQFSQLPDVAVIHNAPQPFAKLLALSKQFKIILCVESLGRLEILRQTLLLQQLKSSQINNFTQINADKIVLLQAELYQGFAYAKYLFITEADLYPRGKITQRRKRKGQSATQVDNDFMVRDLAEIKVGDFVVHINHGVGRYSGLSLQTIGEMEYEMIELEYQNNSKLYIPVQNLHLISRYSHLEGANVELTNLGTKQWDKIKAKAEQKVNDIAAELLELYAQREIQQGNSIPLPAEYPEFAQSFGYEPTTDQQNSFDALISDLNSLKPMDRLVCGDVGFGKTEVAMRAAFVVAMNGYQVAILAPTTLLTEQLYQNLVNRFAGFALNIAEVSRFRSKKEINQTLMLLSEGKVDIIVGTHRLIQNDIKFAKLGLVIIDEEHRFGVKQKEKLKKMRQNVDVLTMTATPIPRTLSMALDGLRDFSIIATAPSRRLAVNTLIVADDNAIIQEAILREIRRGGQVFFLYNDVASIEHMYNRLTELIPELRIAIAHGQMPEHELEQTIKDFVHQRYNLLLCSTIIETGIDIPNANTILIYRADKFGLAQLHQLRGRVGRSHHQAYCYLLVPERTTKDAEKRLDAIMATSELGAGFNLAIHDLEIRGAGEILGDNQAGNIKEVGLTLYSEMLKKAIKKLKAGEKIGDMFAASETYCDVNLNVTAILPIEYCPNIHERLIYYKRLAKAENTEQLDLVYQDIIDNYGLPPEAVRTLIALHQLRITACKFGIQKLDVSNATLNLLFIDKPPVEPLQIVLLMQQLKTCKYDGKNKLIWQVKSANLAAKLYNAEFILNQLEQCAR